MTSKEDLNIFARGKCMTMCPSEEMKFRERQNLLHVLETKSGSEKLKKPEADYDKMVKAFNRSAAGKSLVIERNLRPPGVLMKTLHYLLHDIINDTKFSWTVKYDFITDRLRAIRQDMVVQNIAASHAIVLLQPIVRFHAYSSYKLCDQKIEVFDPYLNKKHLQECLNWLLVIYEDLDQNFKRSNQVLNSSRAEFEAFNILLNLGNESALNRVFNLAETWKSSLVDRATSISLNYLNGNYIKVCRSLKKLPPLHAALAALSLPEIRKKTFQIMSVAYNNKQLFFPSDVLQEWLLYETKNDLYDDCKVFKIEFGNGDSLRFERNTFLIDGKIPCRKENFIEEKMCNEAESDLLLNCYSENPS